MVLVDIRFNISILDNLTEAIQELESVKDKRDVILCSLMALVIAHKRSKNSDKQTVQQLEAKLKSERTQCGETALYFGGMFLFHSGRPDKAREYVDRMLKLSPSSKEVCFRYFIYCQQDLSMPSIVNHFVLILESFYWKIALILSAIISFHFHETVFEYDLQDLLDEQKELPM